MDRSKRNRTGFRLRRPRAARAGGRRSSRWGDRRPTTAEEIRIHGWLLERLALLHREPERCGWWARVRGFLGF